MEEINYLGFSGIPYKFRDLYYIDACDMADQVIIASGDSKESLINNFKINVDGFYKMIV